MPSGLLSVHRLELAGAVLFFVAGAVAYVATNADVGGGQPIAFNHNKHIQSGMECTDCHVGARDQVRATLPSLSACLMCHQAPLTQSAEEQKIRDLAQAGKEADWIRITHVRTDVYFSHRRHVQLGKLDCAVCHGPMQTLTAPPRSPFVELTMDACISCHQQNQARTDCNDCHR